MYYLMLFMSIGAVMSISSISIPISTKQFLDVIAHLKLLNSDRDPVEAIHAAIQFWIESSSVNKDFPDGTDSAPQSTSDGYWWKSVFLPKGTKIRMSYKGKVFLADVSDDGIVFQGTTMSPSGFVFHATGTTRNAWRDIEVQFANSQRWISADSLRLDFREPYHK
jgi:hypothetical protein